MPHGASGDLLGRTRPAVLEQLTKPWSPARGDTVLVGVSGGADSMALLHLLAALGPGRGWSVVAASFDHGMRGADGADDVRFVADRCGLIELQCITGKASAPLRSEAQARTARREFLTRAARDSEAVAIALAHTMDDQAETVIMRLGRGCGSMGLGAMRRHSPPFWRPALDLRRNELRRTLESSSLAWRDDPSNDSRGPLRNRVRHDLMPVVESTLGPGAVEALARAARFARDDEAYLDRAVDSGAGSVELVAEDDRVELDRRALSRLDEALARRSVRRALARLATPGSAPSSRHLSSLLELARAAGPGTHVDLPRGLAAWRTGDRLVIEKRSASDA